MKNTSLYEFWVSLQGCLLFLLLFVLYINVLVFALTYYPPPLSLCGPHLPFIHQRSAASTRNNPCAATESPIEGRTVRETGRVTDQVNTTAAHAAPDRRRRDPPGTTRLRGPEQMQRGASPAPPPRRGPAAGTMSRVLGRPPCAPRSRPVNPGARAPGWEGTTATGKPTSAPKATGTGRDGAQQCGATRHAGEACRRPQPRHKARCQ